MKNDEPTIEWCARARQLSSADASCGSIDRFSISHRDLDGCYVQRGLKDVMHLPFYEIEPVRRFPAHRRQMHMPGFYFFATTERLIGYESRLESDVLMMMDYDVEIEAVAAQPFRLHVTQARGQQATHVPDFFALLASGRGRVIDVTRADRRDVPRRRLSFEETAQACQFAGWDYRVEAEPDATLLTNIRALAGYRREPVGLVTYADEIVRRCAMPTTIGALVAQIGPSALVRPVVFHLLWKQQLVVDLTGVLTDETLVSRAMEVRADA